jgi:hypothetical protein
MMNIQVKMIVRRRVFSLLVMPLVLVCGRAFGQSFSFVPEDTVLSAPLGSEMVFNATLTNTSTQTLTLALVRTVNSLPAGWESSMCFSVCFQSTIDSIATTTAFGSSPLSPNESRPFSLHVYSTTNNGTGIVRIVAKNLHDPQDQRMLTFTSTSIPVGVSNVESLPTELSLAQNYPNPFNPTTKIQFSLPLLSSDNAKGSLPAGQAGVGVGSIVTLKVFDMLGREVATLVEGAQGPGNYTATWNADGLASGVYVCKLNVIPASGSPALSAARKMLLLR